MALGVCAFFSTVQACARLIVGTNCSVCIQGGRLTQDVLFLASFLGTVGLTAWCLYDRRLSTLLAVSSGAGALGMGALLALLLGDTVSGLLRFYVAYYACVGVLASGGLALALVTGQAASGSRMRSRWLAWWATGGTSLAVGLILYQARPDSFLGYILRVVVVLVVPAVCSIATVLFYRGKFSLPIRSAAAIAVLVASVVASIR